MTNYASIVQPTTTSALIWKKTNDTFFNPVGLNHTGFAADGFMYVAGVKNSGEIATWFSESASSTRGTPTFPAQALVLVSRASLTIFDQSQSSLVMWMVFYLADNLALTDNFCGLPLSYLPTGVTWANGVLSVVYSPDTGSPLRATLVITINFVLDEVYLEATWPNVLTDDDGNFILLNNGLIYVTEAA